MKRTGELVAVAAWIVAGLGWQSPPVLGQDAGQTVIFEMDRAVHKPSRFGKKKTPAGTVEVVDGKFGKACKFTFVEKAQGGFFLAPVRPTKAWDTSAGISFWVKGDGSKSWGGLEMIDRDNYAFRYAVCFPIDSTEWRKITIPWRDVLPELSKADRIGPDGGYTPSRFGNLWFGKWWYWRDYPACSFTIDRVALEPKIVLDTKEYTPAQGGVPKLVAKLKAGKPVTITVVCDSLGDKHHWANRKVVWCELLVEKLKKSSRAKVTLVNASMGGTELRQNTILLPRVLDAAPQPDLVTVWFGGNDWASGTRGKGFEQDLRVAVDRIRRMTKGKSEILLMTTCPSVARWDAMEELAVAVRTVAAEKKTGLADVSAAFHKAGAEAAARAKLFCWDKTHLGPAGHALAAETVLKAIGASQPTKGE